MISKKLHTTLCLLLVVSLWFCCYGQDRNERITRISAMDTISHGSTEIMQNHREIDSLDIVTQDRADRFYDSLKSKSHRRAFPRFLYKLIVIREKRRDVTPSGLFIDEAEMFSLYEGKMIGNITIDRHQVFEGKGWFRKAGNNIHVLTSARAIRRDLLFKPGDLLDPEELVKNSQLLRSRSYISDVNFEIIPDPYDSNVVNINIVTRDSWTIGAMLDFYKDKEATFTVFDANFLGTGHRIAVKTNADYDFGRYGGNMFEYRMPNTFGSFYRTELKLGRYFDDFRVEADIRKDFILPNDYGFGVSYKNNTESRYEMFLEDTLHYAKIKYREYDVWGGKSRFLPRINSSIYGTWGYTNRRFSDRPSVNSNLNPSFHNADQALFALGFYREKFYTATLLYGYGFKEYLGAGYKIEGISGYNWGEFRNGFYMGLHASKGGFSRTGYVMGIVKIGSFYDNRKKYWWDSAMDIEVHWFSHLLVTGRSRLRQFITINHTHGWNRVRGADERLHFTRTNGLLGFDDYVVGRNRTTFNTETVLFTPLQPIGFRMALFAYHDIGLIGNHNNPFHNVFYSTVGLGIRLKNERLVFNTIQLRLGFAFGKHGWNQAKWFRVTEEQRASAYRFLPSKPEIANYR